MVGNDVVDLREANTPRHAGFDARVFAPSEARRLQDDGTGTLRWALWAAKEAAYKRARRADPAVVFSPVRFVVDLGTDGRGRVRHEDCSCAVRVEAGEEFVHAVAAETTAALEQSIARVAPVENAGAESHEVRRLALSDLAPRLGTLPGALRFERRGRIPWLRVGLAPDALPISLSHHGRFVAWAVLAPTTGGGR